MFKHCAYILPLVVFALVCAFLWRGLSLHPRDLPSPLVGKAAPAFSAQALQHPAQAVQASIFLHHTTLLNVWASWCETCQEEQAFLLTLKKRYPQLQLIGLNFQDQRPQALAWLKAHGNPYDLVLSDAEGKIGVDYGVYGTPESFLIDEQGIIRVKISGVLDEQNWLQNFVPYLHG